MGIQAGQLERGFHPPKALALCALQIFAVQKPPAHQSECPAPDIEQAFRPIERLFQNCEPAYPNHEPAYPNCEPAYPDCEPAFFLTNRPSF